MAKLKNLDLDFEALLTRVTREVKETELTEKKRAQRRKKADADEFEFCRIYFPHIFTDEFNGLHRHMRSLTMGNYTVAGCRKFGKSAYAFVAKTVRNICLAKPGMSGIAMHTQEDAIERTASLVRIITRNKLLMYDYGIQVQQEKKGFYIINNVTLVGVGVREGLRNFIDDDFKRFRMMICDDLYNRNTVSSEKLNDKVFDFVTSEVWGQMEPDGLCIWLYNYISDESPGSKIAKLYPTQHFNLPALNQEDQTNWPESSIYTTEFMHKLRAELPYETWQGDYMNQPALRGEILDPAWIRQVSLQSLQLTAVLIAIDPSYGSSPSACSKGAALLGFTADNRTILLDIYIRKEGYQSLFDWCWYNIQQYRQVFKVVIFENDFSQWAFAEPYYIEWSGKNKKFLPLVNINSKDSKTELFGSDKFSRIMNLVHPYQTGRMVHADTLATGEDMKQFTAQYLAFGKSDIKLDGLDALATAFIKIHAYLTTGTFKPLNQKNPDKQNWLNNR